MILFINVLITSERLTYNHLGTNRNPQKSRLDVFKYSLASLAVIPHWTKCVFYIELTEEFAHREAELRQYIERNFRNVEYHNRRNELQHEWQTAVTKLMTHGDRTIWFLCNDDHVFIDYSLSTIDQAVLELEKCHYGSFMFSHWPEHLKGAVQTHVVGKQIGELLSFEGNFPDSIQICTIDLLRHWWFDHDYEARRMPRTDWSRGGFVKSDMHPTFVPLRECCRHYDGYYHIHVNDNECPPLHIPDGFFTDDIKISSEIKPGYTTFDPLHENYRAHDENGVDSKLLFADIPLFWKDKISEFEHCTQAVEARNNAMWIIADSAKHNSVPLDRNLVMSVAGR
jgi:hypothetical protein